MVLSIVIEIALECPDCLKVSAIGLCCVSGEELDGSFEVVLRDGVVSEVEVILIYLIRWYVSRVQSGGLGCFRLQVVGEIVYFAGFWVSGR